MGLRNQSRDRPITSCRSAMQLRSRVNVRQTRNHLNAREGSRHSAMQLRNQTSAMRLRNQSRARPINSRHSAMQLRNPINVVRLHNRNSVRRRHNAKQPHNRKTMSLIRMPRTTSRSSCISQASAEHSADVTLMDPLALKPAKNHGRSVPLAARH